MHFEIVPPFPVLLEKICTTWKLRVRFYLVGISGWRRQWHPTPVLLPEGSHGQRSLVGCNPWCSLESDMTERLHFHFSLSCIGEGNGNPLQCSCLENPKDGEPGGLLSTGSYRVRHNWNDLAAASGLEPRGSIFGNHGESWLQGGKREARLYNKFAKRDRWSEY